MHNKEKIIRILADNYFQAASSECDMFRITDILEEVRKLNIAQEKLNKIEDRLEIHLGESLDYENEFGIVKRLLQQLRDLKRENYKTELIELFRKDEKMGWQKWLRIFGFELSKANSDTLNFLLKINLPIHENQDYRLIKKYTKFVSEERWPESLPLFEYFIGLKNIPKTIKAELFYIAGQIQLYHFSDFNKTLAYFKKVNEMLPGTPRAERAYGDYYIQKNEFDNARKHLQKALDLDKKDFESYLVLGNLYKAENRYDAAESWYNEGIRENPGKADLYNRILLLNEHAEYYGKHKSDVEHLVETIIKLDSTFVFTAYNNAGFIHQKNGNFEKAEKYYKKAIGIYPKRIQGYTNLGYSYLDKNDLQKAEEAFKKAIETDRKSFDGYWGLVALNRKKGDWNALISNLKICEKYRPQWRMYIYNDFGNAYEKLHDLENAQKYYLLALNNDPQSTLGLDALLDIAELDLEMGKGVLLLKTIRKSKGPGFDDMFNYRLGVIYYKNQLYNDAVRYFEKASSLIQSDPIKLEYMGLAYEKTGDVKIAEALYRRAIEAATTNKSKYYNRLAFFLTYINRCEEAIELLNTAIELKPDPMFLENRGYAHEILGHYEEALENYKKALELSVNDKDIYENRLGIFYYNRGKNSEAIGHYNAAISLFPKSVYYENIGLAFEFSGDLTNAEISYRKAIELENSKKDKYLNRLGFFLSKNVKHEEAVELFRKAIGINEVSVYYENLGFSLEKLGQLQEAEENYRKAIWISSGEKDVFLNRLGIFYYNQQKYNEAVTFYKQAINYKPKAVYFENLGNAHLEHYFLNDPKDQKEFENFENAYLKAAELEPNNGRYYFQLGWRVLIELNDTNKSKEYLNKALEIFRITPEIEPDELLSIQFLGAAFQQEGNLDKAEEIFNEAYNLDQKNDLLCNFLGKVYLDKKEYEKSLEFYTKALTLEPHKVSNIKNVAEVYHILGETEKEIETYLEGVRYESTLYGDIGKLYYRKDDFINAEKYIRLALNASPDNYLNIENLGLTLQKLHKYNEAITEFSKALELAPLAEKSFFNNYIGNCWFALNEMQKAAGYYLIAYDQDPNSKIYFDNLILALKGGGQQEEAKKMIEKRLEKEPENGNLINQLGLMHFDDKDYDKAILCFKKNIELNSESYIPYDNLGFSYEKMNQPEKAIEAYERGIPHNNGFYEKIGKIYFNQKEYIKAETYIRKAHEMAPENDMYLNNLGIVLAFQNKIDDAIAVYLKAIEKAPDNPIFYEGLSRIKESLGEMEEAIQLMEKATEKETKLKDRYLFELGKLYEKAGDFQKAKTYTEEAVNMYPELQYFDQLGKLYFNDGDYEKATEIFLKAVKSFPDDEQFRKNFSLSLGKINNEKIKNQLCDEALSIEGLGAFETGINS